MTSNNDVLLKETATKGRYYVRGDGNSDAELTFSKAGSGLIIIDHTEVPDAFRGKGVGARLIQRVVEDARERGVKIIPLCPFANSQFHRHPQWADVLKR
ncbi:MAG: GNAT family N-acetyltransferase [Rhizobiaceae bacterium]